MTQLKVLYDVRLREIEKLKNDLEAERDEKEHILRKLNVCEHDKKKVELNLSSCQSLLSEYCLNNFITIESFVIIQS